MHTGAICFNSMLFDMLLEHRQRRKSGAVCWQTEPTDGSSVVCQQTAGSKVQSVCPHLSADGAQTDACGGLLQPVTGGRLFALSTAV